MATNIVETGVFVPNGSDQNPLSKYWFQIGLAIGLTMLLGLAYGAYNILFVGHHTLGTSKEVPWGIFIVIYAFCISSIGLSYIASFGIVLGFKQFDVIAKRALFLGILIIVAGMISVGSELQSPFNAWTLFLTTHPTSALGVVGVTLNVYLLLICLELYLLITRGHEGRLVKAVAIAAFATALVVHSYHGAIFGLAKSRAFWGGPYYPIYFLLSALFASSSLIILVTVVTYRVRGQQISAKLEATLKTIGRLLVYLLATGAFFLYWKVTAAWYFHKPAAKLLLFGEYWVNFWIFEVLLGYLLPIFIILLSRFNLNKMAIAAAIGLVGLFVSRYDFIIIGELYPYLGFTPFKSTMGGSMSHFATYAPSPVELAYAVGLLGLVWTGYVLGVRFLPLGKDEV